jgi:hypothetical protein
MGSVIDNGVYANATLSNETLRNPVPDFKKQVEQWINFEKQKKLIPLRHRKREWTIFTVQFGVWDMLKYAQLEKDQAIFAIDRSIEELFHGLNAIVEYKAEPIKVVLPALFDITFFPRFAKRKDANSAEFARGQHLAVFLVGYWNSVLNQAAMHWAGGEILMPDNNRMLVDQIRARQLYAVGITDGSGAGKQKPLFYEVETPCLSEGPTANGTLQRALQHVCEEPTSHLFW